jgi:hypothetical protein
VIDIRPALEHFRERGANPAMLFSVMPSALFEHYLAQGRTPAEIYNIAYGKNAVTCRPKPDRRQAARTAGV